MHMHSYLHCRLSLTANLTKHSLHPAPLNIQPRNTLQARSSLVEARHNASGAGSYPRSSHSTHHSNSDSRCDALTDNTERKSAEPNVSEGGSEPGVLTSEDSGQVNPVDIGLKVANEIIGLHSQAAAAGRALAHSTRHVELMQEENTQLKVGAVLCCACIRVGFCAVPCCVMACCVTPCVVCLS